MKYQFANAEQTLVRYLDDGSMFQIERHQHPSNVHGFAAERWRASGCPAPDPYREPVRTPDDNARARRRAAGEEQRRIR
jgi:hypothetical protein